MYHYKLNLLAMFFKEYFTNGFNTSYEHVNDLQIKDPFVCYLGELDMCDVILTLDKVIKDNFYDFSFKFRKHEEGK